MAPKKKKPKKKTPSQAPKWLAVAAGWVLVVLGFVLLLSFLTFSSLKGPDGAVLGPFFGKIFPEFLHDFFGKLASFFLSLAFVFWGVWLVSERRFIRLLKFASGFSILVPIAALLVQLREDGSGGLLGRFLWNYLLNPLFGGSMAVPLILCIAGILAVCILAFGLRLSHFAWIKALFLRIRASRQNRKALKAQVPPEIERKPGKKNQEPEIRWDDTQIIHRGKAALFKGGFETFGGQPVFDVTSEQIASSFNDDFHDHYREDEIDAKMRYLAENKDRLTQRERAELRKEIAELRRLREQSQWENERRGDPKIEGVYRKNENQLQLQLFSDGSGSFFSGPEENIKEETQETAVSEENSVTLPFENTEPEPAGTSAITEPTVIYQIPEVNEILPEPPEQTADYSEEELQEIARDVERQLENFKIKGRVIGITTGPMITRFEVEPGPGVKVSRFAALQEDLALALKASAIRVLAPIPGKSVVGIEIPNRRLQTVYCREILESEAFRAEKDDSNKITVVLGKDITGNPFTMNLARAPHILIAGQTGSGKSVCINVLMASLLFSKTPEELRLILVDPKVVELKLYEQIPHLMFDVITQPDDAVKVLQWACREMDARYEILAKAKVRNLAGFNQKAVNGELPEEVPEEKRERMPFLVIIVDELADLMMVAGKEVEKSIARIAQKARAVGIHLVLATQRPSVNVITGLIKANLPTRLSFKVASQIDARTVMDRAGAEKLIGRGDMLFRATEDPEPHRIHGAFLSDSEAEKLADFCSSQGVSLNRLDRSAFESGDSEGGDGNEGGGMLDKIDALLFEVALFATTIGKISTSLVQRRFGVGYARAGKIVDQMERLRICSEASGSKPREILLTDDEIRNLMRTYQ